MEKYKKSRLPQDNRSRAVGTQLPYQRPVGLMVVLPRADSEKAAPIRIIRKIESSCVPLHILSTELWSLQPYALALL